MKRCLAVLVLVVLSWIAEIPLGKALEVPLGKALEVPLVKAPAVLPFLLSFQEVSHYPLARCSSEVQRFSSDATWSSAVVCNHLLRNDPSRHGHVQAIHPLLWWL